MSFEAPYVIAEIASAHEGDISLALEIFNHAASTGTNAVKFQIFNTDSLLSKYNDKYDLFKSIELEPSVWLELLSECSSKNVDLIAEVYDFPSLELTERTGAIGSYKIPTSDIGNLPLIEEATKSNKPLILAVGGATYNEIEDALNIAEKHTTQPICLMHGFQSFPTRIEDSEISRIRYLKKAFGHAIGYADHVDASQHEFSRMLPIMALSAGAEVIEKHITNDRDRKGLDYYSSLNPDEFKSLVCLIRDMFPAVGKEENWELSAAEKEYRHLMKKQAVAAIDIPMHTKLTSQLFNYKRINGEGLTKDDIDSMEGSIIKKDINVDKPIMLGDIYVG